MASSGGGIAQPNGMPGRRATDPGAGVALRSSPIGLAGAHLAAQTALYHWDLASDALEWSENAAAALGIDPGQNVSSGRHWALLLDPDNVSGRYDAIHNSPATDRGEGVAYEITYRLCPEGRDSQKRTWIEDCGAWYAGADGRPAQAMGTVRRIDERYLEEERLHFLAGHDQLTGHLNRAGLTAALEQAVSACQRRQNDCAFLLAGIDRLAMINESYGFDVADELIARLAQRLETTLRRGDTIGRYAGNKVGIILVNTDEEAMQVAADRLLDAAQGSAVATDSGQVPVTISIGGVVTPRHARSAREAMMRAEEALGHARASGTGGFDAFRLSEHRETARRRNIKIADEIVGALNERRFAVAFQPIVAADTGEVAMYETLLRLIRASGEVVAAGSFIETAEQLGLARLVDLRVLELTLEALGETEDTCLTINVSALTARAPEWLDLLRSHLKVKPEFAARLIVEITETVAIDDIEESSLFVTALRDLGCRIAIDDFGAGYTSFRNLKLLNVDMVKIDGGFISDLHRHSDNQVFVRALIDLASKFKLATVAEWVNTEEDAQSLRHWGVDYLQGFLYGAATLDRPWASQPPVQVRDVPRIEILPMVRAG